MSYTETLYVFSYIFRCTAKNKIVILRCFTIHEILVEVCLFVYNAFGHGAIIIVIVVI